MAHPIGRCVIPKAYRPVGKGQGMAAEAQQRYPYGHTSPPDWGRRLES